MKIEGLPCDFDSSENHAKRQGVGFSTMKNNTTWSRGGEGKRREGEGERSDQQHRFLLFMKEKKREEKPMQQINNQDSPYRHHVRGVHHRVVLFHLFHNHLHKELKLENPLPF
eukprot:TRINITY_DN14518_c0_g1_i2.p1 TRINITY_DN14518_c0_g1~~TRINITY_DN14518_c0_g1_i2.p1  ORF type:complete len:113 (-),score=13.03 TRINITY_DN14518_c0_g1_i2:135-473(-)